MPSLLKRLSTKSFRRRNTSDISQDSEHLQKTSTSSSLARSATLPPDVEKGQSQGPNNEHLISSKPQNGSSFNHASSRGTTPDNIPPLPTPPATVLLGMPSPQFYDSPHGSPNSVDPVQSLAIAGVMDRINGGPKLSKAEKVLNKIGNNMFFEFHF